MGDIWSTRTHEVYANGDEQEWDLAKYAQIRHDRLSRLWRQARANERNRHAAAREDDEAHHPRRPRKAHLWKQLLQGQREDDSSQ